MRGSVTAVPTETMTSVLIKMAVDAGTDFIEVLRAKPPHRKLTDNLLHITYYPIIT